MPLPRVSLFITVVSVEHLSNSDADDELIYLKEILNFIGYIKIHGL